ncbi:MAG: type II toxin-antitoxin system VapC family toxin [Sphingobacteriaceae bacterium]|nr:MAG: type II toxin-antitoxin system VapC family toxin [Sphingobacteriaceae bacterium]
MKILLDTHILVWFAEGIDKLPNLTKLVIENLDNQRYVSIISLWEIVIKASLKKSEFKHTLKEINLFLVSNDINLLSIDVKHLDILSTLPFYHKDPFDRLLIAQAIAENLTLISVDQHFQAYAVNLL